MKSGLGGRRGGVGGVGRGLGQVHVQDLVVEQHLVPGFSQYLGYLLGVLYLADVQVG